MQSRFWPSYSAAIYHRVAGWRGVIASPLVGFVMLALFLVMYLWNAPRTIDYPYYDESYYLMRGVHLAQGDIYSANLADITTSPLMAVLYAIWYSVLHSADLYPWVFITSICLLGTGAYFLLVRMFHPFLSWAAAVFIVVSSTPICPYNANYLVGAELLWLGLACVGRRPISRGIGALIILGAVYARPEYLTCLMVLCVYLAFYELRELRRRRTTKLNLVAVYLPFLLLFVFTGALLVRSSLNTGSRTASAIPWSYVDYLTRTGAEQASISNYIDSLTLFERDFGHLDTPTVSTELVAILKNPSRAVAFLGQNTIGIWAALGQASLAGPQWRVGQDFPISPNFLNTIGFAVIVALVVLVGGWVSRRRPPASNVIKDPLPVRTTILALLALIPWLILINPAQRAFMILPLLLLPLATSLTVIAKASERYISPQLRTTIVLLIMLSIFVIIPHPFRESNGRKLADSIEYMRKNLPNWCLLAGIPAETFANYLYADGLTIVPVEASSYSEPALVNAYKANPWLRYVVLSPWYPDSTYQQWFNDWGIAYPDLKWTLMTESPMKLYRLEQP